MKSAIAGRTQGDTSEEFTNEPEGGGGLCYGITSYMLRILCDNPWNGGAGYLPSDVGKLTPDQIYFRLCNAEMLKYKQGGRTQAVLPASMPVTGVKVRLRDGSVKVLNKTGKTKLDLIREKLKTQSPKNDKHKKRRKHGT